MYRFIKSSTHPANMLNGHKSEVAFIGRSNVGKSSLINAVVKQNALARTSNTPGRTQLINFFQEGNKTLVDLPGYGYARISKTQKQEMFKMIDMYFKTRKELVYTFLLVDSRQGATEDDIIMFNYLKELDRKFLVVLTKTDKLNQKAKHATTLMIEKLNVEYIFTSSKKKLNINKINEKISEYII